MPIDYPDYLRPISDDNRDEYILVEFHRTFINTNMSLLQNLFEVVLKDKSLISILPGIADFAALDPNKMYDATVMFNHPAQMIKEMSQDRLSDEICNLYAEQFMEPYHFSNLHYTRLEFMIHEMLEHKFVKTIFLFAPSWNDEMKAYLQNIFRGQGLGTRVLLVAGNFEDCISELPQITTIFMSNVQDLLKVYEKDPNLLNGKYILISDGYENMEPSKTDPSNVTYIGLDLFEKLQKERKCMITYIYPSSIEKTIHKPEGETVDE